MWSGLRRGERRRRRGRRAEPPAQIAPPARLAWCLTARKPLFLRPEAPRPQVKSLRLLGRRGASPPANPYSFVRKHHAPESKCSAGGVSVVPHLPQTLIPSSGSTTPSAQTAPPAGPAWCSTARKTLFLRPEAPRPQPKWLRRRGRRAEPPQLPPPPKTGQVPAAGLPQTQSAQFMEMK